MKTSCLLMFNNLLPCQRHKNIDSGIRKVFSAIKLGSGHNFMSTYEEDRKKAMMARGLPKRKPIDGVKNIVLIASGKGGVGKSTVAVNLAVGVKLQYPEKKVGLLDADVFGPSLPIMMNLNGKPELDARNKMLPLQNYGVKCMSMGFLVDGKAPVIWRGLMVMQAIDDMVRGVAWDPLDVLFVDMPPGTGDTQLSFAQSVVINGAVMVTTPQKVALQDTMKGAEMFKKTSVPLLGFVLNMSSYQCPSCGYLSELPGTKTTEEFLSDYMNETVVFGRLPFLSEVSDMADQGRPVVISNPESFHAQEFCKIGRTIMKELESRERRKAVFSAPASAIVEYNNWRGRAYLDDRDMIEIANWMEQLDSASMDEAVKYYWVNNEVMYAYGALVRSMFSIFNASTFAEQKFSKPFLQGVETIIHYILLKSFPVVGRLGGIRGSGRDQTILKAPIPALMACYKKFDAKSNFSEDVFPIARRRKRNIPVISVLIGEREITTRDAIYENGKDGMLRTSVQDSVDDTDTSTAVPPPEESWETNVVGDIEEDEADAEVKSNKLEGRYLYSLSHGSKKKSRLTKIKVVDADDGKYENIGATIFWLIYELIPPLCSWSKNDAAPLRTAFDKILGLVVSMYLYDSGDFAEEYERIFKMTTAQYESEWKKIEYYAKKMQRMKKLVLPRPYSDIL